MMRSRKRLLLEIDLTRPFVEVEPDNLLGRVQSRQAIRWRRLVAAVHDAAGSEEVAGLVATVGTGLSLAQAQELRAAVKAFEASGKPTVAWAESYGEMGNGTAAYFLATGFDEIWLQPSGAVGIAGVAAEVTFLRGLLDKVGVQPQFGQRKEFKSAADRIMRSEFTPAHKEMVSRLTDSAWEQVSSAISEDRSLSPEDVTATLNTGPLLAKAALDAGLIDYLGYREHAYAAARKACGDNLTLRYAELWHLKRPVAKRIAAAVTKPAGVALVDVVGEIVEGRSRRGPRGPVSGSTSVSGQLRAAAEDPGIAAVVLRVDSPGGSAVGSDTIWHAVSRVRNSGKPVIASMGTVAGSGGYFVSCNSDVIVADPATLTGSIGVVGGKADIAALLDRIGVTTGAAERGERARMFSARRAFTADEVAHLEGWLDEIYDDFVAKVAAGRSMSIEAVEAVARGRVWTGADAAERGLVDTLGGLRRAVEIAKDRAGLAKDAIVRPAISMPLRSRLRPPTSSSDPRSTLSAGGTYSIARLGTPAEPRRLLGAVINQVLAAVDHEQLAGAATDLLRGPRFAELLMPPVRFIG